MRKLFCTSYFEHKIDNWVQSKINFLVGPQEPLLATVMRRKLAWFGYVPRHDSLSKTILGVWATLWSAEKSWMDNIKECTSPFMPELLTGVFCRKGWERISAESSLVSPQQPSRSRD